MLKAWDMISAFGQGMWEKLINIKNIFYIYIIYLYAFYRPLYDTRTTTNIGLLKTPLLSKARLKL